MIRPNQAVQLIFHSTPSSVNFKCRFVLAQTYCHTKARLCCEPLCDLGGRLIKMQYAGKGGSITVRVMSIIYYWMQSLYAKSHCQGDWGRRIINILQAGVSITVITIQRKSIILAFLCHTQ